MDRSRPTSNAAGDRLSKLEHRVLGHILSFLPAKEAARASSLSSRWRDVFAGVHTVSLEEPEPPIPDPDDHRDDCYSPGWGPPPDPNQPPPFSATVTAALLARHRRRGAAPLRALRVALEGSYRRWDSATVDQWVSHAVQQAAPEGLHLDLRLRRVPLCASRFSLPRSGGGRKQQADGDEPAPRARHEDHDEDASPSPSPRRTRPTRRCCSTDTTTGSDGMETPPASPAESDSDERYPRRWRTICRRRGRSSSESGNKEEPHPRRQRTISSTRGSCSPTPSTLSSSSDDTVFSSEFACNNKEAARDDYESWQQEPAVHTVTRVLFSCAALRSLSLGSCRLATPARVALPSLETLLLFHVTDPGRRVERLVAGCPRLADLALEACNEMVRLYVPSGTRLRRLAIRCCHKLATVAVDASRLEAFEYRGAVPDTAFLTLHGGSRRIKYCKVDICGEEVSSEEELVKLRQFLQLFANARHLHLESARLGFGIGKDVPTRFPALPSLRHLELRGRLPDDDDTDVVGAVSRILGHAPNLEALSLVFHPQEHDREGRPDHWRFKVEELLDAHHLSYNPHSVLAVPSAVIPCLRSRVREINLVHYQGGRAQRMLAKFLLCNAPVMDNLWCEFAEGPLWSLSQLMREIKGWVMNKSAKTYFF